MKKLKQIMIKNKIFEYLIYFIFNIVNCVLYILTCCMAILPIKQKKIVCSNMKGKRYGDNPKYIIDEILKVRDDYDIVWLIKQIDIEESINGIRYVKYGSLRMLYELVTAKIWIDSNSKMPGIHKRKSQYYIQTWHGSYGLKKVYGDIEDKISLIDKKFIKSNSKIQDLMISNSEFYSSILRRAFWYSGEIMQFGSPRNDIFFKDNNLYKQKVLNYFQLKNKKIVLYAPTYRNNMKTEEYYINCEDVINALEKKYNNEWVFLIRLHPHNLEDAKDFIKYNEKIINASNYDVMQELLVAADILISDYSSCMFDFITVPKPCFIYATDIKDYKKEREIYFELEELPFLIAENNDELVKNIVEFDNEKYKENVKKLFNTVKLNETGNASSIVANRVIEIIENVD